MIENPLLTQNPDISNQSSEAAFQEYDAIYGNREEEEEEKKTQVLPEFLNTRLVICCLCGIIFILSIWLCHAYHLF